MQIYDWTLFQKPKIVPSNNLTIKVGQTLSGKIDFKNNNMNDDEKILFPTNKAI